MQPQGHCESLVSWFSFLLTAPTFQFSCQNRQQQTILIKFGKFSLKWRCETGRFGKAVAKSTKCGILEQLI
jgi:hypothetical protein